MFIFEDGTLVENAYVEIDGVKYPVTMPTYSGSTEISSENLNKMQEELLKTIFPIGSIYITQTDTNPNTILKFGTWERFKGKIGLGVDENDTDLNQIGKTGGEKEHQLTVSEMAEHQHVIGNANESGGEVSFSQYLPGADNTKGYIGNIYTDFAGANQAHNNMQPFEVVGYMWIRRS